MSWMHCTGDRRRHWGRHGAAGLLVAAYADDTHHVLLDERADWVHFGGTVGVPGGAIHPGERPIEAALREVDEEVLGLDPQRLDLVGEHAQPCADCLRWTYTTIIAWSPARVPVEPRSMESAGLHWTSVDDVEHLPLHPGFALAWPRLRALVTASVSGPPPPPGPPR